MCLIHQHLQRLSTFYFNLVNILIVTRLGSPKEIGVRGGLTVPSAKAEMTFPRADRDLLIFFASSRTAPAAPVLLT